MSEAEELIDPKPKRGFAAWTPEEREAARVKAAETRAANTEAKKAGTFTLGPAEAKQKPKQKKDDKPLTAIDRATLVQALELANAALDMTSKPEERWGSRFFPTYFDGSPIVPGHPMAGRSVYSLEKAEIEALADAWYKIAQRYTVFGSALVAGRTLSVWGNALFVTYVVVGRRVEIAQQLRVARAGSGSGARIIPTPAGSGRTPAGGARSPSGDERIGENDVGAEAALGN